jgi:hypothetical protein
VQPQVFREKLDQHLRQLNDDYAIERSSALKEVFLEILPSQTFIDWMQAHGKMGGQHKFPRVLKGKQLEDWQLFLAQRNVST